ncbi:AAA family ATPase [Actinoplanes sichuanensis]|uniref:histidine kinase n=1 Tax=Actinoplanes sichuanensis TaxID=512349 RepID=A0ABW4AUZ8_9ACTN|nr:AAA family ATPase [Actinoplanes sichuanensis]BEL04721.1 AAA family ATPase [Actinoplanes sichuanensis]
MAAGGTSAVEADVEVLYESDRTRVARVRSADGTEVVIRKDVFGADAAGRRRHERAILERLAGVVGVPDLVCRDGDEAIVCADVAGAGLDTALAAGPLDPVDAVEVAVVLAGILAEVHRRGVVHRDISPSNVLLCGARRRPALIDFDLATTFAEERPAFTHENRIVGTLAYLAPEQTGRTARPVDRRADLYGFGATLYEMLTGGPPFGFGDPLRLTHDHLARTPVPPAEVNPLVPPLLSDIVGRLLEKEPDRRYQSADGLAHDLSRLLDGLRGAGSTVFPLGERDFPVRLVPPSRLVGRDTEITRLRAAFDEMMAGRGRGVLVSGGPGVGKSSLIDELRPYVTGRGGWLVSGKCDQYRRNPDSDAVRQAMRALCRLLLAEPEEAVAALVRRLHATLDTNVGLAAAAVPELAPLMDVAPDQTAPDPRTVERRLVRVGLDVLRVVASPERPVVLVLDDLQWAGAAQVGFIDAVLTDPEIRGLLLVGAYRDAEIDNSHPLAAASSQWAGREPAPERIRLANLPPTDLGVLLAQMLRLGPDDAAGLAEALVARTGGNPYDSVEVVNALRREGVLVPGPDGWRWDADAVRRHVGRGDVLELVMARIDRLPPATRDLLTMTALLGGEVTLDLLAAAAGLGIHVVEESLRPALEDGLLLMEREATSAVRFRHDRVQEAAFALLAPVARQELSLKLARRLAPIPQFAAAAAEQYLPGAAELVDRGERLSVAGLFQTHAAALRVVDPVTAERLLAAALALADGEPLLVVLEIDRHAALFALGRTAEADEVYRSIERRDPGPEALAAAANAQIPSLVNRGRVREAMVLGLDLLGRLGVVVPAAEAAGAGFEDRMAAVDSWVAAGGPAADLDRPEVTDPSALAVAGLLTRLMPIAHVGDPAVYGRLVFEGWRLWVEHGPCAELIVPLSCVAFVEQTVRQELRSGYTVARHAVAVAQARGYGTAPTALLVFNTGAAHWFERLEGTVAALRRAHDGLLRAGDPYTAAYCRVALGIALVDSAPTLTDLVTEVEASIARTPATCDPNVVDSLTPIRQLARALRGETAAPASFDDDSFDESAFVARLAANPIVALTFHTMHGIAEVLCGSMSGLAAYTAVMTTLLPDNTGEYCTAIARLLCGIALAERVRTSAADERVTADLAACGRWFAARAADAPDNFAHLADLIEAEQAWALGDAPAAASAFDAAIRAAAATERPWHRALILERAARFHTAQGLEHTGRTLLAEARAGYEAWGATAKVRQIDGAHPEPAGSPATGRGNSDLSTDAIDLLAVLNASQALSSETNLDRIRARVSGVLSAMTGATAVQVLLRDDQDGGWRLPGPPGEPGATVAVEEGAARGLVPMSVVRYAERTREPLLVDDAVHDDRFARDPYLTGLTCCSLLVLPIFAQGVPRAILLLENRLARGAFTTDRLDAVRLIAGQLAVSIDNALLYASLEAKVAERTATSAALVAELQWRNRELEAFSGSVSHDLRGPLQVIGSYTEQVLEDEEGRIGPESLRRLGRVQTAAGRMTDLVESLLVLARASRGQLRRAPFDLTVTARQVIDDVESRHPASKVDFTVHEAMTADADEGLIRVVLENLINNAVKFTRDAERPAVEIGRTDRGFFVRDNGVGFPAGKAAELFQPFARLHSADEFPGTGIGLTTVHRVVERHGGQTWAEGAAGRGATFWFTLPPGLRRS